MPADGESRRVILAVALGLAVLLLLGIVSVVNPPTDGARARSNGGIQIPRRTGPGSPEVSEFLADLRKGLDSAQAAEFFTGFQKHRDSVRAASEPFAAIGKLLDSIGEAEDRLGVLDRDSAKDCIERGSTKDDVQRVMGVPNSLSNLMWTYGSPQYIRTAYVDFDFAGRLDGYTDRGGILKICGR